MKRNSSLLSTQYSALITSLCVGVSLHFQAPVTTKTSSIASNSIGPEGQAAVAQRRVVGQLRLSRLAGRIFLRRLFALRRDGALFTDYARRRQVRPKRRFGARHLQRIPNSLRVRSAAGALVRNAGLQFICQPVQLRVEESDSAFTGGIKRGQLLKMPVKHGEGLLLCRSADPRSPAEKPPDPAPLRRCQRQTNASRQSQRLGGQYRRHLQ